MKTSFNIGLVEVKSCTVLKNNICYNIFWSPYLGGTLNVKFGTYLHEMTIFKAGIR
jgi:hypothetical protein